MEVFRALIFAALCAGLLSGVVATAGHQIGTVPLILEAERYEQPATPVTGAAHQHAAAWEPQDGVERTAFTLLADVLTGIGFALLLAAALALRGGEVTWRDGLIWGLAGFASFSLAPSLGLPPQLPGTEGAPLFERQAWWVATALSTGCSLGLFAFTTRARWAILAAMLMVLPHLYGAPQAFEHSMATPASLAHRFVVAATVVNFLFWVILGASVGYFYRGFARGQAA
jgi:cobalt transporter subunit CbtA